MREILFKAKRIDNGEWVEGYYQKRYDEIGREKYYIFRCESNIVWEYAEVDANTLCQYTGLTDKNGRKIWENDVVCTPYVDPIFGDMVNTTIVNDFRWKVVFYDGLFVVENETKRIYLRSFTNGNNIEVVGNIFDNREYRLFGKSKELLEN